MSSAPPPPPLPPPPPSSSPGPRPFATPAPGRGPASSGALRVAGAGARQIGRYAITGELGRGGMGVVYRAVDPHLHRDVAIKMIRPGATGGEAELARFVREARASARLRHPGIVAVHEVGEHEGQPYLVMELVAGESLDALLERERVAPRRSVEIVRDVALALQHAHDQGVVHRDVKPQNIMIAADGNPRLMDFGLARDLAASRQLTVSGQILGTPSYMAPEQASPELAAQGPRTDVYALGAVLFRALVGRPPFLGEHMAALVKQVLFDDPPRLRRLDPSIHPDLETIALECLEKEPARRYESARALAADLGRFLDGEAIAARPVGAVRRAARRLRRSRLAMAGVGLVALAVVAVAAVSIASWRRIQRERAETERALARQDDRTRRALLDEAAGESARAASALAAVRVLSADDPARRTAVAVAIDAWQAAERFGHLAAGTDRERDGRQAVRSALEALLAVALDRDELAVARVALEAAADRGVDAGALDRMRARLLEAERRIPEEHRRLVEESLDRARRDELRSEIAFRREVDRIVVLREAQTVELLAEALDEVTADLRRVVIDSLRELPAGSRPAGLDAVLDRWAELEPEESLPPEQERVLDEARRRFAARSGADPIVGDSPHEARAFLALEQRTFVGEARLRMAELCCAALGRLGLPGAVPALMRHLRWERAPARAVPAAEALCALVSDEEAAAFLRRAWPPTGANALLWQRLLRVLPQGRELEFDSMTDAATRHAVEGMTARQEGRLGDAIESLSRSIERDPSVDYVWSERGLVRSRQGKKTLALADLSQALALNPRNRTTLMRRGIVYLEVGRAPAALRDFTAAIQLAPDEAQGPRWRAKARRALGDREGALADLLRAIELAPEGAEAEKAREEIARLRAELGR